MLLGTTTGLKLVDLTQDELRAGRVDDAYLYSIATSFSFNGVPHVVIHTPYITNGNHKGRVLLYGPETRKEEFAAVESILSKVMAGYEEAMRVSVGGKKVGIFNPKERATREAVCSFAQEYERFFGELQIPITYFREVPEDVCANSGFPAEKQSRVSEPFDHEDLLKRLKNF